MAVLIDVYVVMIFSIFISAQCSENQSDGISNKRRSAAAATVNLRSEPTVSTPVGRVRDAAAFAAVLVLLLGWAQLFNNNACCFSSAR